MILARRTLGKNSIHINILSSLWLDETLGIQSTKKVRLTFGMYLSLFGSMSTVYDLVIANTSWLYFASLPFTYEYEHYKIGDVEDAT